MSNILVSKELLVKLANHIQSILDFVSGKSDQYTYVKSKEEKIVFTSLENFPDYFFLLVSNKELTNKQGNALRQDLNIYIHNLNYGWQFFTFDHLHPYPVKEDVIIGQYNATVAYNQHNSKGTLWLNTMGIMQRNYLNYLLYSIKEDLKNR